MDAFVGILSIYLPLTLPFKGRTERRSKTDVSWQAWKDNYMKLNHFTRVW